MSIPPAPHTRPVTCELHVAQTSVGVSHRLLTAGPWNPAVVRSQDRAHSPAGDRPILPFLPGRGQLGLDAIGFLTQPVDPTASGEFVLFLDAGTEVGTYGIVGLADGTLRVDRSRGVPIVSGPRALTDEGLDAFTMRVQRAAGGAR